jgi:hypothetical protein
MKVPLSPLPNRCARHAQPSGDFLVGKSFGSSKNDLGLPRQQLEFVLVGGFQH